MAMKKRPVRVSLNKGLRDAEKATTNGKMHKMNVDIDLKLFRKFKAQCTAQGLVMSDLIRDYIKEITK